MFWAGLRALSLSYEAYPGLQALISPVASLIGNAIFRPKSISIQAVRFSLNIRPLSELVVMHHTRAATNPLDKVYSLLGMSSDDDTEALSVDYEISWSRLLEQLVRFYVPGATSVNTWDHAKLAVINCKGRYVGQVSAVLTDTTNSDDQETFVVSWRDMKSSNWTLQALTPAVQVGDMICLLEKASRYTILRRYSDYWVMIRVAVPLVEIKPPESEGDSFLLVWFWDMPTPEMPPDCEDYLGFMSRQGLRCSDRELDKATRLHNIGQVLHDMGRFELARDKFQMALKAFENDLVSAAHHKRGKGEGGGEKLITSIDSKQTLQQLTLEDDEHSMFINLLLSSRKIDGDTEFAEQTPLWMATENGHTAVVKVLLESKQVDLAADGRHDQMMLWCATANGHAAVIKVLLESKQVDPVAKDDYSRTMLWFAREDGHAEVVKVLLESDQVDPAVRDDHGRTAPWVQSNSQDAMVTMPRANGMSRLESDVKVAWHKAVAELPRESNIPTLDMTTMHIDQWCLWMAAVTGYELLFKKQLRKDQVKPDARDRNNRSLIWWAAEKGHAGIVRELLRNDRVDPEARDYNQQSPLWIASARGHAKVVKILVNSYRVNPGSKDDDWHTPLHIAARFGHAEVVRLLVGNYRVDSEALDRCGQTPLHVATMNGHTEVIKVLVDSGLVDLNATTPSG